MRPTRRLQRSFTNQMVLTALSVAGNVSPVYGQLPTNPPKVQKNLEKVAAAIKRKQLGAITQVSASVGYRLLIVHFEASTSVSQQEAVERMNEINWDRDVCSSKEVVDILNAELITFRVVLRAADGSDVLISDVTASSCAHSAATDPKLSRIIGGVAFAPKPTRDAAMAVALRYFNASLLDPDSAKIECGQVTEAAWIKPMLERRRYGYFLHCTVNAKNAYGGYAGAQDRWFRFNGDDAEHFTELPQSGLMEPAK